MIGDLGGSGVPEAFPVYLSQLYRVLDEDERNTRPPRILLQLALFSPHLDSLIIEGPPPAVQRAVDFLLVPAARALGYRSFYEHCRI